jgi:hypothetical protein
MATPTNLPAAQTSGNVLTAAYVNDLRGAFRVLQVVQGQTSTLASSTSTTWADSGITATITPQSNTNKILVFVNEHLYCSTAGTEAGVRLVKDSTVLQTFTTILLNSAGAITSTFSTMTLDSPATTSATTYKTQFQRSAGTGVAYGAGTNGWTSTIILMEVSA